MKSSNVLRVGLYERVSTDEQALRGYSIETQIENLEAYCKEKKYKIVDHYTDAGVSGGKAAHKRPEMSRLLKDVEEGKIDLILFTKLDRWFRSVKDYFTVQEILEKNRVEWKTIHEDYDTMTANGRMAITIYLAIAQNEREKGSERINVVFEHKRRNKEACFGGKTPPYGYKKQKDENGITRLVIDPETEEGCREFWRIVMEGNSVLSAGKIVNASFGLSRSYPEWQCIFNNELYRGIYKGVEDFCTPYVEQEAWAERKAQYVIKTAKKNRIYLFTGMMLCPSCGCVLRSNYRVYKDGVREYYSYRCRHRSVGRCDYGKCVSERKAEKWLIENVRAELEKYILSAEVEDAKTKPKPKCDTKKITEKIRRLNVVYMAGGKSDEEYTEEMADLKRLLAEAEKETVKVQPRDLSKLKDFLASDFENIYGTLEQEEKRQFWRAIIDTLVIDGNHVIGINFKK